MPRKSQIEEEIERNYRMIRIGDEINFLHKLAILIVMIILGALLYATLAQWNYAKIRYLERHKLEAAEQLEHEII